jgi:hypothetical protein
MFNQLNSSPEFRNQLVDSLENQMNSINQNVSREQIETLINDPNFLSQMMNVGGMRNPNPNVVRIPIQDLTETEQQDIKDLTDMGFDKSNVIQFYLASGKNKEVSASLLYDDKFNENSLPPINNSYNVSIPPPILSEQNVTLQSVTQQSVTQTNVIPLEPNVIEPNIVEPNIVEPNIVESNIVEPNIVEPNVYQSVQLNDNILFSSPNPQENNASKLSEEDLHNIQMIVNMGFEREVSKNAYTICNKNTEQAINMLLS